MFAFVTFIDDQPEFVQTSAGHIYVYSNEAEAILYFGCIKSYAHMYRLEPDLSAATLVEAGDVVPDPPQKFEPAEDQKEAIYTSFPYKSLLQWTPIPDTIIPKI